MRPGDRAEQVVGRVDVGDPVAHRLVDGVLEGAAPGVHGHHLGAEQAHPGHVQGLPPGVLLAHVDDALETEQGRRGRGGDAVLARAGLGDHPRLAHLAGEQRLAQHVVDLVRAGVVEVLALEQDPRATGVLAEPARLGERAGATGVRREQPGQLGLERTVRPGLLVGGGQLVQRGHQRLGDEPSSVGAEVPGLVGVHVSGCA